MDGNASSHREICEKWKEEEGILSPYWPSRSPNVNKIENIWAYVQNELYEISDHLHSPMICGEKQEE